jgi:hypothetical protein
MTVALAVWLRAPRLGWFLGIPIILLLALAGEAVGIGGAQVLVGLGMGTGVGLLQGRAIHSLLGRAGPWVWSSALGLALPFFVADVATAASWGLPYSLHWCVAVGGLIVGGWQALLLRPRFSGAAWWVAGSVVGWALAAATAAIADVLRGSGSLRGLLGAAVYLGTAATGGLVLGVTTGLAMRCLTPRNRDACAPTPQISTPSM